MFMTVWMVDTDGWELWRDGRKLPFTFNERNKADFRSAIAGAAQDAYNEYKTGKGRATVSSSEQQYNPKTR